ncbi:MAG: glucoamylase family protein [Verrucomicrobiota bacterium]
MVRLEENQQILQAYNRATLTVDQIRSITPAAEWVLDNFYLIQEQIQMAWRHLPRHYSRELPRLSHGPSVKLPRVYDIALELILHVDAQIDLEQLTAFVDSYQSITPLNLGELWAVPIMLRLGLIENLRRIAVRLNADRRDRDLADFWANRLQETAERDASGLIVVLADMAKAKLPINSAFVTQLCQRLSRMEPAVHFVRDWIERRLAEHGSSVEQRVQTETQNQAADQVSIRHSITSLRFLGATDWQSFVESMSYVDKTLRQDPANLYAAMDFTTRDCYRHIVERMARQSHRSEIEVATTAIALTNEAAQAPGGDERIAHVGYHLMGPGQLNLEKAIHVRVPWETWLERSIRLHPMAFYGGGFFLILGLFACIAVQRLEELGLESWRLDMAAAVVLLGASQLAVTLLNWLCTQYITPRLLPRLDFSKGIPAACQTMVVIPTILTDAEGIDQLLEKLEIHYLGNRDNNAHFALLTDFRDAAQESMPEDQGLARKALEGIKSLNQKYRTDRPNIFYLFHRPRRWNAGEGVWMGYERKRGKLAELNALLRGRRRERFAAVMGDESILPQIKYVITLDTDTQLPRDAARQLVGTMAHPLNHPQFDLETELVREGYSILQPRVGISLPSSSRSWFVRIFAGDTGIDPYTRNVSDVYQDVFNEGSFIGKGIYDVDAFERALRGRFPENVVLSHDLIESVHARSGLVSDVELYEEHPSRYNADVNRRHRWIRGDWQIAPWLLPRVPGPDARKISNPLNGLSQWKIMDNLRRSLVPPDLTLVLVAVWVWFPELAGAGAIFLVTIIAAPGVLTVLGDSLNKPEEWPWAMHLKSVARGAAKQGAQSLLALVFMPYDAFVSLDAIGRTLGRMFITHRRLLEWQTTGEAERRARTDLAGFYETMWAAPALGAVVFIYLCLRQPGELFQAMPFLILWLGAPCIAWWISQPIVTRPPQLSEEQQSLLRKTARKTWHFFETFVTERENWLPPDNFQEIPSPVVTSRTSPTNMGLALLANLTACDFGYVPVRKLMERTGHTVATLQRLERHRGHFYNWYNTETLAPLHPLYISSVDSGNLAGHLLLLSAGLTEYLDQPILGPQVFHGLLDTLGVLQELAGDHLSFQGLRNELAHPPRGLGQGFVLLHWVMEQASDLEASLSDQPQAVQWWSKAFAQACRDHLEDILWLAPWLPALSQGGAQSGKLAVRLDKILTLREVAELPDSIDAPLELPGELGEAVADASRRADERIRALETLAAQARDLADMDFTFLYDSVRQLFSVGFNVGEHRRDASFYDLLASESRLCSYVAIAQGQIPQKHWFSLGRLLAAPRGDPVLLSWGGSMFEYLMPLLVMPTYENTLMDQSCRAAVRAQIDYGRMRGVPWGISESGYNLTDAQMNYQYSSFGVPGLGFKRGLADNLVIAPYASALALLLAPKEACENLQRLATEGRMGDFGFYEAVDYTPSRLPPNETSVIVRSALAHHQGMSLLSFAHHLLNRPMQRRFFSYPPFKAEELLLQERVPKAIVTLTAEDLSLAETRGLVGNGEGIMRVFTTPHTSSPEVHLLSNGRYHVLVTNAGGGYSRWQDLALTRWQEDVTRDCWGYFCYLRDVDSGEVWSMACQPTLHVAAPYEAIFTQARAEFRQRHGPLEIHTEIAVSPEDDVEMRRITLTNHSHVPHTIELTTYAEVVLAPAGADAAHRAFSNLFVQTEYLEQHPAILCTRRKRSEQEQAVWLFHLMTLQGGAEEGEASFETDRARFIGRGRTLASPAALQTPCPLSNTAGSVLDPIVSMRRTLTLAPEETTRVEIVLGVAASRQAAGALVEKYHDMRMADRLFDLAWTHSQVTLRHLDATEADAQLYASMATALVYATPRRRANSTALLNNRRGQTDLWSYGISGDSPIVLLQISHGENMELVRRLLQAHAYWRMKGLAVELIIVNEDTSIYRQTLQDRITGVVNSSLEASMHDRAGGIFVRRMEQIPPEDRILLQSVARIILSDEKGTLEEQFQRRATFEPPQPEFKATLTKRAEGPASLPPRDLIFFNGCGGFTRDGREYVMTVGAEPAPSASAKKPSVMASPRLRGRTSHEKGKPEPVKQMTPAPWVNVLANARFGTVVSESGGAFTWLENSHEFRLTPWHNDPVTDVSGEALYLRDEETGEFWSPTPLPACGATPYVARHGFGYSVFEHTENGVASEVWIYVAAEAPVKFVVVKLRNLSQQLRRLSVTGYWEWVLGELAAKSWHVQTVMHASGAFRARNPYNTAFADRIAFVDTDQSLRSVTGDRTEFLGRNGTLARPAALRRPDLSGKTGTGLDPCGALRVQINLQPQKETTVCFRLGAGRNEEEVNHLIVRFRKPDTSRVALEEVRRFWNLTLGAVEVETPDPATNLLSNGWLVYQVMSSRLWGRAGFYQAGGAFGFRDQLQDAMALVHTQPGLLREQLLRAAEHQFREGDVQHWWHPPGGRGVRTHFSDDYLWLPYATCRYVNCLHDVGVLDERIAFLEGRAVKPEEEGYYDLPARAEESGTLYEHCVRAIEHGLKFGEHGLPLIGCGDWNDGLNLVGAAGRGESVWLGFFLFDVLTQFADLARRREDITFAERCLSQADLLLQNIEKHAWDGQWYRRAYFDDGTPLGSRNNAECQIDSLPQSWSVLAGPFEPERSRAAMRAVEEHLVCRQAGLIQLFDPPFEKAAPNPGYIKGYLPGVRENGGQYTHAAVWAAMAFAQLGEIDRAWELFSLLNPINHASTPAQIAIYKVEPYVVAGDVYAVHPHVGRGGWTWYTGSTGWMYRLALETLLGVTREGDRLRVEPHLPKHWSSAKIHYRYGQSTYHIVIEKAVETLRKGPGITLDDQPLPGETIPLLDDHQEHQVEISIQLESARTGRPTAPCCQNSRE